MQPDGRAPGAPEDDLARASGWPADEESPAQARWRRARIIGRYEDFLRCTVDWLWETDATLTLTYVSSPVALKLGIPAKILIGRPLLHLGRFEPTGNTGSGSAEFGGPGAIELRQPFRDTTFVMTGAERREVAYRLNGIPYFDEESGRFDGYRGTAVAVPPAQAGPDTTDRDLQALAGALEEALLHNRDLTSRLSQMIQPPATPAVAPAPAKSPEPTHPLDRTAHELRTPLNAIIGYADLGLNQLFGPLSERYLDCFRTIREAGRHLDEVVTQMRDSAKEPGKPAVTSEVVDIGAMVAKAKAMIALAARASDVDISRVGPMAGGKVFADHRACTQILVNLLSNAVKFTPAGGSIGIETIIGPDDTLQVVVWDTGIGIPPEEQRQIFEPDYRALEVRALNNMPGLGLGLAISRDLARAMGGGLTVVSQPGQGSRFILSLPLAAPPT